jgi:nicotinamidase-related amidase
MATIRSGNTPILLVVDVQVDVMRGAWDAPRVVGNVAATVERARAQGVPVVWVQHEDADTTRGSSGWQLVPELAPKEGDARIYKRYESAFEDTPLEATLAQLGATRIVLVGASTNWCIRATAYGTLDRGYDLVLVKDAHTTKPIDAGNGKVAPAEGIVDDLNVVMTWIQYPGRKAATTTVGELDFAKA